MSLPFIIIMLMILIYRGFNRLSLESRGRLEDGRTKRTTTTSSRNIIAEYYNSVSTG